VVIKTKSLVIMNKLHIHTTKLKLLGIVLKQRQGIEERMWSKLITVYSILIL
jgi:hypothetical protein